MADLVIPARSYGGTLRPRGTVVHDAETPLRAGYALSLATNWFGASAPTSAHTMVDPRDRVRMVPDNRVAYHSGPNGNGLFCGDEQAGYARFTRQDWLSADGIKQMTNLASVIRERHRRLGLPLRVVTDPGEVRSLINRGQNVGVIYHVTVRDALGGTSHWDPGTHYPTDHLQEALTGASDPVQEDDDMAAFPIFTVFAQSGTVYCANRVTGTYRGFKNETEYAAFLNAQARSGIPVDNWGDVGAGFNAAAHFGTLVQS